MNKVTYSGAALTSIKDNGRDYVLRDLHPNVVSAGNFAVIAGGQDNEAKHDHAILLGSDLKSDRPFQVKVGVGDKAVSLDLDAEDYATFRAGIFAMLKTADPWKPE